MNRPLTRAQLDKLWKLAHHKYGWAYAIDYTEVTVYEALVRRGLVQIATGRTHGANIAYAISDQGRAVVGELWPKCPFILGTYQVPVGGWTPKDPAPEPEREAVAA